MLQQPSAQRLPRRDETQGFEIKVDDQISQAYPGETVAAVLLALGRRTFTEASAYNLPRTLFCGMGICHQCLVMVDGVRDVRACMTKVRPGLVIETRFDLRL